MGEKTPIAFPYLDAMVAEALRLYKEEAQEKKTDCYYYSEFQDGPATIPECRLTSSHERPHCACQGCPKYLDKKEADEIIRKYISGEIVERK